MGLLVAASAAACTPPRTEFGSEEPNSYLGPAIAASADGRTEVFNLDENRNVGERIFQVLHPEEDRPMADAQFLKHAQDDLGRPLLAVLVNSISQPPENPEKEGQSFMVIKDVDGEEQFRAELPFMPHHTFAELPPELSLTRMDGERSMADFLVIGWGKTLENGDVSDDFHFVHVFKDGSLETKLAWNSSELPNWDKVASLSKGQAMHSNGLDCGDTYNIGTEGSPDLVPVCAVTALVPSVAYVMDLSPSGNANLIWDSSKVDYAAAGLSVYAPHSPDLTAEGKLWFFNDAPKDDPTSQVVELDMQTNEVLSVIETEGQKTRGAVTVLDPDHVLVTHSERGEFCVEGAPNQSTTPAYDRSTYADCAAVEDAGGGMLRAYFVPDMYWAPPEL